MTKKAMRVAVSLALTVALLTFFLWNVDLTEVGHALETASPGWLLLATILALLSYWLRAVRWQLILMPLGRTRHSTAVLATVVGYAAMALLPARLGDIVRPLLLARRDRKPASGALASILTERVLDLWTVLLFFIVFMVWPPPMEHLDSQARSYLEILRRTGYLAGAGLVVGTIVLLGLFRYQDRFIALVTRPIAAVSSRWREPVASFLGHFLDGLRVLQRFRDLVLTVTASVFVWFVIYWQVRVTLLAFSIDLPLRVAFFLVTLSVIGLAIPTPGGVGGFHKAIQIGLTMFFGIGLNQATGIALVHHAICFLPITIIGLLCLPAFGISLRDVDTLAEEPPPTPPVEG